MNLNINPIIENYLANYKKSAKNFDDSVRKKTSRVEIVSSYLLASVLLEKKEIADELLAKLKEMQFVCGGFEEKFYQAEDEDVGAYGAVPTSFACIAVSRYYKKWKSDDIGWLLKCSDLLYKNEAHGAVLKAILNRSKVFNTDLLSAQALREVSDLLDSKSIRLRMYDESIRRSIARTLIYQFSNGSFPYQSYSLSVPYLYHAMVSAQLKYFCFYYKNEEMLKRALVKSRQFSCKFIIAPNGDVDWKSANNHDKSGSIWIYSFLLSSFSKSEQCYANLILKLRSAQFNGLFRTTTYMGEAESNMLDPFFSSWVINGLIINNVDEGNIRYGRINIRILILFLVRVCLTVKITLFYLINRLRNFLFFQGAHENRAK